MVETTGGKYVDFPVHVQRNSGIGYRAEGVALPTAGQQGFASVHVPLRYGYGVFQVTGQTMQLSDTNEKAFAKALTEERGGLEGRPRQGLQPCRLQRRLRAHGIHQRYYGDSGDSCC